MGNIYIVVFLLAFLVLVLVVLLVTFAPLREPTLGVSGPRRKRRALHLSSEHKGCVADVGAIAAALDIEVVSYNVLTLGGTTTARNDRYNVTRDLADTVWETHSNLFLSCDVWWVSDTSPMARILMSRSPRKPLVVWGCNRADYAHRPSPFPVSAFYTEFRDAPDMTYVPYTAFEARHVRQAFNKHVDHPRRF